MAVVGCGQIGHLHARAIGEDARASLVAVCDLDQTRAEQAGKKFGAAAYHNLREMLCAERIAAVTIATPDYAHIEPALAAMEAGCHLFCEKPLAENYAAAERMARVAMDLGVHLAVDYNRRFGFGYRVARRLMDESTIGELQGIVVLVSDPPPRPPLSENRFAIFTTLLTHHFDLVRWFGGDIGSVLAVDAGSGSESLVGNVHITCALRRGGVATIIAHYRAGQPRTWERMDLVGSQGTITVDNVTKGVTLEQVGSDRVETFRPDPLECGDAFYQTVIDHLHSFIGHVACGESPDVSSQDALASLAGAEAAIESLQAGRAVALPNP
jgi:predicted dehydrogenase